MKRVYWINGPICVGKTTVAQALAKACKLPLAELDNLDEVFTYKGGRPEDWWAQTYSRVVGFVELIAEEKLIIAYPISQEQYSVIQKEFQQNNVVLSVFTLQLPLSDLRTRGDRQMSNWEMARQEAMYNEYTYPPFGHKLDANRSVSEIVADIKGAINEYD